MDQDTVDSVVLNTLKNNKKVPSIEALNSEMPCRDIQKDKGKRMLRSIFNRIRMRKSACATISKPDPTYKVTYLGNVVTGWAKGDGCVEKPLATLWRNYTHSSRPDVRMQLSVSNGGLKATTKDHGLTEYWAHRLTTCIAPAQFPRLFCWVYRHEGRRLRHELRCHAVLCSSPSLARQIEGELKQALVVALAEFKKDKISRQNARLSLANSVYDNPTIPRRKILLSTGSNNYRPPLERSKSAPKLTIIEESLLEEEEEINPKPNVYKKILRHYDSTSALLDKRKCFIRKLQQKYKPSESIVPVSETCDDEYENISNNNNKCKVSFESDVRELIINEETSNAILDELVKNSMKNDLLESCERAWYNALVDKPDLIPPDSDEGSLSSGCESASTITSEHDQPVFTMPGVTSTEGDDSTITDKRKTELDFKVGGSVLPRVRSLETVTTNPDILKFRGYNGSLYNSSIMNDEVSLIPVGETQSDFSSLKVFKKKVMVDPNKEICCCDLDRQEENACDEDNGSACSDESGYEEEDVTSSVANIILV